MGARRLQPNRRAVLFRIGAVLLGVLPFLLFELVLYGIGWQQPGAVADPYVGFTEVRPLFDIDASGENFAISDARLPLFRPDQFSTIKPRNEFRIFCVGGSTVQGRPLAIETAFSTWLELSLQAADPSRDWNAINCGGVSYASYRLAPIVEEIIEYQPDLIVLYTGHNEFLEDRTYDAIKRTSPWVLRTHGRLSSLKTYSFLRGLVVGDGKNAAPSDELPADVEARLDFKGGMEKYQRDEGWKRDVTFHFEHNLRRMVKSIRDAGVPLILCNPVSNLRDASPFKSQNGPGLTAEQLRRFNEGWSAIKLTDESASSRDLIQELAQLKALIGINPQHAALQFRIAQAYQQLGEFEHARQHYLRAKEEDICPLRIIEPMHEVIERVAKEFDVPVVDVKAFFEARSPNGIPGAESLVDHVHPTIYGHQLIAGLLLDEMAAQNMVRPGGNTAARDALFQSHLESIPNIYFELGKDRLAGLKRWAEGKVTFQRGDKLPEIRAEEFE